MKKTLIALIVTFAIALSFVFIQPITSHSSTIINEEFTKIDPETMVVKDNNVVLWKGMYYVLLKDEYFSSVDNDPKFADKDQIKASNIPEKNAKVVPALKHEYEMKIAALVYEKVRQYNGTATSSLSPLKIQGGHVDDVWSIAVQGVRD